MNYINENKKLTSLEDSFKESMRLNFENEINFLLEHELSVHLDYEKYERYGWEIDNSRKGYYSRTLQTSFGKIQVKVPRDINNTFQNTLIKPYSRRMDNLENTIIHLYSKGITTREISKLIERLYGHHYSAQTMSNITDKILERIEEFHTRKITSKYKYLYLDCTYFTLKRGEEFSKEAVYIVLGINEDGYKEILEYEINPTESATYWREILTDLKQRGLNDPDLVVSDNLSGIANMVSELFVKTKHQNCIVHVQRNILNKVSPKHREEISNDFKLVYKSSNVEEAKIKLKDFTLKYEKIYPRLIRNVNNTKNLFTFLEFPKEQQRSIYTTNLIESTMNEIKKDIKNKNGYCNEKALDKILYLKVSEYNVKKSVQRHPGFTQL